MNGSSIPRTETVAPVPYVGSGSYCFSNSVAMALSGAIAVNPSDIEVVTGSAFGAQWENDMPFFDPPGWTPDLGLTRFFSDHQIAYRFDHFEEFGSARASLADCLSDGHSAVIGPVDIGMLPYRAGANGPVYSDHFVVVADIGSEGVVVHDPSGYPYSPMSWIQLEAAWRADTIAYDPGHYPLWTVLPPPAPASGAATHGFLCFDAVWPRAVTDLLASVESKAMARLAAEYESGQAERLHGHLIWFALPLAACRWSDVSTVLGRLGRDEPAGLSCEIAAAFGRLSARTVAQPAGGAESAAICIDLHDSFARLAGALGS